MNSSSTESTSVLLKGPRPRRKPAANRPSLKSIDSSRKHKTPSGPGKFSTKEVFEGNVPWIYGTGLMHMDGGHGIKMHYRRSVQ
ncbi:hypothetical protein LAG90_18525 [Marinilongibacter aquaticus]|uniref:hypothetical protein n=1 Tax=Marinilongibacter aquaticus TaxID=2975157 RepID=UPI0021BD8495|nr:hypothetical protein [Marinilongibacter aquaticus]UBM58796.1 hypothetical protein LAG90_18525 [Marinilongibacter aquaticus]